MKARTLWYVFLLLARVLPEASPATHEGDVALLTLLKSGLDSSSVEPGSCVSSWDFSVDPCDNLYTERFTCGFSCEVADSSTGVSRVTEIALDHAGYSGSLERVPFNEADYLRVIDLSGNNFYGSIPESLHGLTQLTKLVLSSNNFAGTIPSAIGTLVNLEELFLDGNALQGDVPVSFASLVGLKRLDLQNNRLAGRFPDFGSLVNLNFLDVSNNEFSGEIPYDVLFPASLVQLTARNNSLQGTIPESLQTLNYLQVLDLSSNQMTGSVPSFFFTSPSLQQINLASNQLSSIEQPTIAALLQSQLVALDLSANQLEGFLPEFMAAMPKLCVLSLEDNRLSGVIPLTYAIKAVLPPAGVSQFSRLLLGRNYLFGSIPSPFLWLFKRGFSSSSTVIRIDGNCLYRCPMRFFFCQGDGQRAEADCKAFLP